MPYHITYHANGRIIFQVIKGHYSAQELGAACIEAAQHMDMQSQRCYVISDLSKMSSFVNNLSDIRSTVQIAAKHPNLAMTISYGAYNPIVNFVFNTMASLLRIPAKLCANRKQVIDTIAKLDENLAMQLAKELEESEVIITISKVEQ